MVAFDGDAATGTKKLNALAAQGWQYVGPLGNGLVAFRRQSFTSEELAFNELTKLQGTWSLVLHEEAGVRLRGADKDRTLVFEGNRWALKNGDDRSAGWKLQAHRSGQCP